LPIIIKSQVFLKQGIFLGAGLLVMIVALSVPTRLIRRYAYVIFGLCIIALVAVLLFGVVSHGSRRWFSLGSINFQPSEVMKLALIIGLARYLSSYPPAKGTYKFSELIVPFLMFGIPMGLIMKQPDLGTALSIGVIGFSMVLFMGIRFKALLFMFIAVLLAVIPAWYSLHDYQKRRVKVLLNPESDPQGSGWHIQQSKIAVGSGQIFGKGFLQGTQTQLEFLPERTTDFVFCVLAEEAGFAGSLFIIGLYAVFIYRLLRVALRSKEVFPALLSFGIAVMIFFHVLVNIGMVIGLFPIVGLPLPLLSYGGSALVSNLFSVGIVLGVSMRRLLFVR
jgi:rod shape determining protein RodA